MTGNIDIAAAARAVRPFVRDRAEACETNRTLTNDVVDELVGHGLMRLAVPAVYGGPQATPMQMMDAIATVAEADGAAGWCVMIASATSSLAHFLPADVARLIYGDPHIVTGGAVAPSGRAVRVDGGWRVSGRWGWGSGTRHSQWVVGGAMTDTDEFRLMFLPGEHIVFHDNWYSSGLRGTGSGDFETTDAFVPDAYTVPPLQAHTQVDVPLAHFPNFTLLAVSVCSAALGIARRAIDETIALAQAKTPAFARKTLAESATAQIELSRAEATLSAGRAFLFDAVSSVWDRVVAGEKVTTHDRVRMRLAGVHAVECAVKATDAAYTVAGGSAVFASSPLQRCLRDVHTVTQHMQASARLHETFGRVILGVAADVAML